MIHTQWMNKSHKLISMLNHSLSKNKHIRPHFAAARFSILESCHLTSSICKELIINQWVQVTIHDSHAPCKSISSIIFSTAIVIILYQIGSKARVIYIYWYVLLYAHIYCTLHVSPWKFILGTHISWYSHPLKDMKK